jgi:uncharacterized DUF497 family protein
MQVSGFDWDKGNIAKCLKHGVSLAEIESLFAGKPLVAPNLSHSHSEDRYIAVGRTMLGHFVFVAFTLRRKAGRSYIRPISARYMHRKEIEAYEKKSP